MARHQHKNNLKKFDYWIADGGGAARGALYRPYLRVQDVPSRGNVNRVKGWKTGRTHHFMSNLELQFFLMLEWSDIVTDVNEQFPLDLAETQSIAEQLRFKHPTVPVTQQPNIMTTDFKITLARGLKETIRAVAIKPSRDLTKRTLEKLEIERRFWVNRNVHWSLVTEQEINVTCVRNIQWLHPHHELQPGLLPGSTSLSTVEEVLLEFVATNRPLADAALAFDKRLGLPMGCGLALVRHFLATKRWFVDMNRPINPTQPLKLLNSSTPESHGHLN